MSLWAILIIGWFAFLSLLRLFMASRLILSFSKSQAKHPKAAEWPSVMTIMALRGGDESLEKTLTKLLSLDYPDYYLRVVVDSRNDPVIPFVERAVQSSKHSQFEILYLPERLKTCTGKISSLLFAAENIPSHCDIIAIFDGDSVLHASCLKEIVLPLLHQASMSTGNRWFCPPASLPAVIRYLWGAFAISLMNAFHVAWGGCMAMRADVFQDESLKERMEKSFSDDTTISSFVLEKKGTIEFVSSAVVLNAEDTSINGLFNFLTRQYLAVRLSTPGWRVMFIFTSMFGVTAVIANFWLLLGGPYWWEVLYSYLAFIGALTTEICVGAYLVRRQKNSVGIEVPRFTLTHWLLAPVGLVIFNYMNLAAILYATFIRQHVWRGITYRFTSGNKIEVVAVEELSQTEVIEKVKLVVDTEF